MGSPSGGLTMSCKLFDIFLRFKVYVRMLRTHWNRNFWPWPRGDCRSPRRRKPSSCLLAGSWLRHCHSVLDLGQFLAPDAIETFGIRSRLNKAAKSEATAKHQFFHKWHECGSTFNNRQTVRGDVQFNPDRMMKEFLCKVTYEDWGLCENDSERKET